MGNIYIFYHIYCNENTLNIVCDQITKIIFSNLYKHIDYIYCFLAGEEKYINNCKDYLNSVGKKIKIVDIGINDTSYERFTLHKIKGMIKSDDKFLYIHTKGVTKPECKGIFHWRNCMEYFLINKYNICIDLLEKNDIVGINWHTWPKPHFSGNFWWTRGSYYLTLPDIIEPGYLEPEFYIGCSKGLVCQIFDSVVNHYDINYNMINYIDNP